MKFRNSISAVMAAVFSVCAVSATAWAAPLLEASSDAKADYIILADEYIDYTKLASIEAVVTAEGSVTGTIGVTDLNGDWISAGMQITSGETSTWKLEGLNGILAVTGKEAVYVQFWEAYDGAYSVDSVKLLDADGKELTPSDTPVERPDVKLPDAVREDIDNDAFKFPGKIDIEQAVGEDPGNIGAIDFTFKWNGENAWNGGAAVFGLEYEDGSYESWQSFEIGNCMDNRNDYWVEVVPGEGNYRFDFSENPVVGLKSIGVTGEISGYATLQFDMWGEYGDEPSKPQLSNVTFYDTDGEVLASLDYETIYDEPSEDAEDTAETESTEAAEPTEETEEAPATTEAGASDGESASDNKGNPDTGVAGMAVFAGLALTAGAAAAISRRRK